MALGKILKWIAIAGVIFLALGFLLFYWLYTSYPVLFWVIIVIMVILIIVGIVLLIFFGPEALGALGIAAEAGEAAAVGGEAAVAGEAAIGGEAAMAGEAAGGEAFGGEAAEARMAGSQSESAEMQRMVREVLKSSKERPTQAPAPQPVPQQMPIHEEPPRPHNRIIQGALLIIAGIALYFVLMKLSLSTPFTASVMLGLGLLVGLFWMAPNLAFRIMLGLGGIGGFIALALIPFRLSYIFTTLWLFFWVILTFAIWGNKALIALMINVIFFAVLLLLPGNFLPGQLDSPLHVALEGQKQAWADLYHGVGVLYQGVAKGARQQYYMAIGDYENGVEANSEKPLGVFLENVGITSSTVKLDDRIDVYARLRAESFKTQKNLTIDVKCFEEGKEKLTNGTIKPRAQFIVTEYESQDIDCIMEAADLGVGSHQIILETDFDFVTSAYIKSYFMEQERIRALRRGISDPVEAQIAPLKAFGITDTNPQAVYTAGPLKIGMGVGQQPIALIAGDPEASPTLGITLDKNWFEGELANISKVEITVPPGLKIVDVDGRAVDKCTGGGTLEQTCTLEGEIINRLYSQPIAMPKTIRVHTAVTDMKTVLADAPLAIRSFKVNIDYRYRSKKQISVTVRQKEEVKKVS